MNITLGCFADKASEPGNVMVARGDATRRLIIEMQSACRKEGERLDTIILPEPAWRVLRDVVSVGMLWADLWMGVRPGVFRYCGVDFIATSVEPPQRLWWGLGE